MQKIDLNPTNVLVIEATSFIGSNLVLRLLKDRENPQSWVL